MTAHLNMMRMRSKEETSRSFASDLRGREFFASHTPCEGDRLVEVLGRKGIRLCGKSFSAAWLDLVHNLV